MTSSSEAPPAAPADRAGLLLMVASAAFFAAMAAFVKLWLARVPNQAVILSRGVLMSVVFVAAARWRRVPIVGKRPGRLLFRGLVGYAALTCYFFAVKRLPLGDAVLLQYSHPVFVALVAPWLLGEKVGRGHWGTLAVALAGVALIVGPSGDLRDAALVGLAGSMLSGLAYMTVRDLARTEAELTILAWFPLATIPGALAGTLASGRAAIPQNRMEVVGHLAVFVTGLLGQITLTAGLARAGAARATAATLCGPVFGMLFGLLLFGDIPKAASLAGALLVLGALARLATRGPVRESADR